MPQNADFHAAFMTFLVRAFVQVTFLALRFFVGLEWSPIQDFAGCQTPNNDPVGHPDFNLTASEVQLR